MMVSNAVTYSPCGAAARSYGHEDLPTSQAPVPHNGRLNVPLLDQQHRGGDRQQHQQTRDQA